MITNTADVYEIWPGKPLFGFRLTSKTLPLKPINFPDAAAAIRYAKSYSRSHAAIIRVYDRAGNVVEYTEHNVDF